MGGDEQSARIRLSQTIKDGLRGEFGKRTVQEVVSGERVQVMKVLSVDADRRAEDFGIQVVDVRIKRIDLPPEVSQSVYRRMEAERARTAKELRSRGAEAAERIRADADRQRTVILAEAYRDAERLRGEGDAKATDTYAKAYGQDPEFYAFYRSLGAYRSGISQGSLLVLDPKSEFFRYFNNPKGTR
jgi:membrane protease subunit HflC